MRFLLCSARYVYCRGTSRYLGCSVLSRSGASVGLQQSVPADVDLLGVAERRAAHAEFSTAAGRVRSAGLFVSALVSWGATSRGCCWSGACAALVGGRHLL
jgi:hypothetical protein